MTEVKTTIIQLREATGPLHKELDSMPVFAPLFSSKVQYSDYTNYLSVLHPIYRDFEKQIYTALETDIPEISNNQRFESIVSDLNLTKTTTEASSLNYSKYELLGMLYVLEGSRHGGAFMYKNIEKVLDVSKAEFSFLSTVPHIKWTSILEVLNKQTEVKEQQEIVDGAKEMFRIFIKTIQNHEIN